MDGQRSRLVELERFHGDGIKEANSGLTDMVSPRDTTKSETEIRRDILHQPPAESLKAGDRTTRYGTNEEVGWQQYILKIVMI